MNEQLLLDTSEAAHILTVRSTRTLEAWRYRGVGPPYIRVGGVIRYSRSDIERWLARRRVDADAERVAPTTATAVAERST
jgi:predicted nucleic acid-binding protein